MKYIIYFSVLFLTSLNVVAQEYYYYYQGEKVPLTKVENRKVNISKKTDLGRTSHTDALKVVDDEVLEIAVFDSIGYSANRSSSLLAQEDCYLNEDNLELTPTGYFNIKLKSFADYSTMIEIANQYGLEIVSQNDFFPLWYSLRIRYQTTSTILDIANNIYETGLFNSCSPCFAFNGEEISYDPKITSLWGLYNSEFEGIDISVSRAWNFATGKGVKLAIVDCGVDVYHQDLEDNIYKSYDCHRKMSPTSFYGEHGTHCAGIAAAKRNNGVDIVGVAPDAQIMAAGAYFNAANVIEELADGINWAWKNGAEIISCSWTCNKNDFVSEAVDSAMIRGRAGRGCIFVKSAGNTGASITFPGSCRSDVIAVGSIVTNGNYDGRSSFGDNLLVCAPGDTIWSTVPDNQIDKMSGTSMACPHVSGVIALMLERNPNLTINQVRQILAETASQIGDDVYDIEAEFGYRHRRYGYGLVNAYHAVINTPKN